QPVTACRTPFPRYSPPDPPIVIVVSRRIRHVATATRDAERTARPSDESGHDVAREQRLLSQLDRRKVPVGFRTELEAYLRVTGGTRRRSRQAIDAAVLPQGATAEG